MSIDIGSLRQRQSLPLDAKILFSTNKVTEWYNHWHGDVYVSFSGGKDSTVLLDLVRSIYPNVPAVFVDTGLEYPEIREFVKTIDNVIWLKPEMKFKEVIEKHGYPVVSKAQANYIADCQNPTAGNYITRRRRLTGLDRNGAQKKSGMISKKWLKLIDAPFKVSDMCCDELKKKPIKKYNKETGKKGIIGLMAHESQARELNYMRFGCNAFGAKMQQSRPISIWTEDNIWEYIKNKNLPYSKIYDMGAERTGCMFCMFGVHLEKKPNRFQRMKQTHPKQYNYCINKLGCGKVLDYIGVNYGQHEQLSLTSKEPTK